MTPCRSCGATHPDGTRLCARTHEPVEHGPCGRRVDRYQVERLLGAGGFGGVYIATHANLGQRVAIKLLKGGFDSDPDVRERFLREARAAAAISSPHVVRVTDFGETPAGEAFLVMELLAGRDLDAMLRSTTGPQPESRCVALMLEILAGLSAAHRAGVVHRDLKPANIFLAQEAGGEIAKLVDFGISHARLRPEDRTLTAAGMILGTPAYMAPEQILGQPIDQRVDVYAAGVVLYQMLSGALPHEAATFERLVVLVCTEEPRPVRATAPHLPMALAAVVDRAVAREPNARFASADAFADALRTVTSTARGAITSPLGAPRADHFAATEMQLTPVSVRPLAGLAPTRRSASIALPALIIGGLLALCVGVVIFGLFALVLLTRDDVGPRAESTLAVAPTSAPPIAAVVPQPLAPIAPSAREAPVAPAPLVGARDVSGVHWGEARALGDIDTARARLILRSIASECDECRLRGRSAHVNAQIMFGGGDIAIAQANPNESNDTEASRCVATRFREGARGIHLADSGILIISAELDPL